MPTPTWSDQPPPPPPLLCNLELACLLGGLAAFIWLAFQPPEESADAEATGSIGRAFEAEGWEVVSVDLDPKFRPTVCCDVMQLDERSLGSFDMVWASPVCTSTRAPSAGSRGIWWRATGWCFARSRSSATYGPDGGPWRTRRRAFSRRGPSCRAWPTATCATANTGLNTKRPRGSGTTCPGSPRAACAARGTAARPSRTASTPRPPSAAPPTAAATSSPSASCTACPRGCATRSQLPPAIHKAACASSATKYGASQAVRDSPVQLEAAARWRGADGSLHRNIPGAEQEREDGRADQRDPGTVSHGGRFQRF